MPWAPRTIHHATSLTELLIDAMRDCSPVMAQAEHALVEQIEANFATESAAGDGWQPLAQATLEDRARKGFGPGPILERTGELRKAATSIREHDHESAAAGAPDDHYAKYHASSAPRSKIPLRDFLAVSPATIDKVETGLVNHIEKGG